MPAHRFPTQHKVECGLECPRYRVPLRLPASRAEVCFAFILDTGADISLVPLDLAEEFRIQYDRDAVSDAGPITLGGRLDGHTGQLTARLLVPEVGIDASFPLPCFFYKGRSPEPPTTGPPGRRIVDQPPDDLQDWMDRSFGDAVPDRPARPFVLGRLGFLSRFRVLLHHNQFLLATDDESLQAAVAPPQRRRRR